MGRDSSNSSQPPSQDGPAAKAKARGRQARPGRAQGGQKGHPGASLAWAARPDETLAVEPGTCGGCGAGLAAAPGRVASAVQVLDIPPAALMVTEYQMMSRTCGCGQVTTAPAPAGLTGGPVCYGPGVTAAATLLASTDVIGIERAADLMGALFSAPVSTGFVSRCLVRLDAALTAARFEDALKDGLKAADVLGTDETPAPLTTAAASAEGCTNPHVYTVRTMNAYTGGGPDLIWYGAAGNRTKASITSFGILDGYRGVLVRDDYGGYLSYDGGLAGVQQCLAHLYRYLDDAYATGPDSQAWTRQVNGPRAPPEPTSPSRTAPPACTSTAWAAPPTAPTSANGAAAVATTSSGASSRSADERSPAAAMVRRRPARLWASCGALAPGADLWGFCGLRGSTRPGAGRSRIRLPGRLTALCPCQS